MIHTINRRNFSLRSEPISLTPFRRGVANRLFMQQRPGLCEAAYILS